MSKKQSNPPPPEGIKRLSPPPGPPPGKKYAATYYVEIGGRRIKAIEIPLTGPIWLTQGESRG